MLIRYQAKTSAQYLGRTKSPTISSYLRFLINRDARVIKDELYQKNKTVEDVTKKIQ